MKSMHLGIKRVALPPTHRDLRVEVSGHPEELLDAELAFADLFSNLSPEFLIVDKPDKSVVFINSVYGIKGDIRKFFQERGLNPEILDNNKEGM